MTTSVLLVAHAYHPGAGAASIRLGLLAAKMIAQGATVDVLTIATDRTLTGPSGETIIGVDRPWLPRSRLVRTAVLGLRAASIARRYDVVVTDPPPHVAAPTVLAARVGRGVAAYYLCDSWTLVARSRSGPAWQIASRLFALLESAAVRSSSITIASTPHLAELASTWSSSTPVELVRNGTDLSVYSLEGEVGAPAELPQRYFLYAGTMGLVHGSSVFLEAAQRLWREGHEFGLYFVGSGADADLFREAAQADPARVLFSDPLPSSHIATLYRGCLGALSSMRPVKGYEDARPVKTLAGMACGAPPVFVGGGELADELRAADLGFVAEYSVDGAYAAMARALGMDDQQRESLGARCADYAREHFDQGRAAARTAESLLSALPRHAVSS